jgi:hypothetical protein
MELRERDGGGRFLPGNRIGVGHGDPIAARRRELALVFFRAVSPDDIERAHRTLMQAMDSPDHRVRVAAATALLDRAAGKPEAMVSVSVQDSRPPVDLTRLSPGKLETLTRLLAEAAGPVQIAYTGPGGPAKAPGGAGAVRGPTDRFGA